MHTDNWIKVYNTSNVNHLEKRFKPPGVNVGCYCYNTQSTLTNKQLSSVQFSVQGNGKGIRDGRKKGVG